MYRKVQDELLREAQTLNANIDSLMKLVPLSQKKPVVTNPKN